MNKTKIIRLDEGEPLLPEVDYSEGELPCFVVTDPKFIGRIEARSEKDKRLLAARLGKKLPSV